MQPSHAIPHHQQQQHEAHPLKLVPSYLPGEAEDDEASPNSSSSLPPPPPPSVRNNATMNHSAAGLDGSEQSSSSSSHSPPHQHHHHNHDQDTTAADLFSSIADDEDDNNNNDASLLSQDPLGEHPITFKRSIKKRSLFDFAQPSRLITSLTSGSGSSSGEQPPPSYYTTQQQQQHDVYMEEPTNQNSSPRRRANGMATNTSTTKDGLLLPLDWHIEGPGRRVGYEDLTAIDWIFEYTKERTRLRKLRESARVWQLGSLHLAFDAAQEWMVLVMTGLLTGTLAAIIDITTDWLGDLKAGYCAANDGGAFYLNRSFCCLGYDEGAQCMGWRPWAAAVGISSAAGKWVLEYLFFVLFSVFFAFCASTLVKEYAMYAKHSGIPEIKTVLGGFVIRRFLGAWTLVTKSLGLCLSVASGMWLGKEGPLVHVACCCANLFIKLFPIINKNEARKREVLSAAAASGISVAFGSPIGGVLFSLEQISYYFPDKTMWKSFVCASTAALVLKALDPFRTGETALYHVKYDTDWHGFEIGPFVLLGVIGGIYGGLFIKLNMRVAQWKKKSPPSWLPSPVQQVMAVALLTAVINYPNLYMRAQSSELVSNLFSECSRLLDDQFGLCKTGAASAGTIILLLFAAVLGFFLAAVTFGLQIPAGIILPSMAIGALSGRAVGIIMELWVRNHPTLFLFQQQCAPDLPCINPGTYAIIGAAATLAGVTRMTVSIVVIMFELTGALTYVLPIMLAVMLAKWVGDALHRRGIYEAWIHANEYPFLDNTDDNLLAIPDVPAAQIMTRTDDLVLLPATGLTLAALTALLAAHNHRGFPVVTDYRDPVVLLGYISRMELLYGVNGARALPPSTTQVYFSQPPPASPQDPNNNNILDLRPFMDQTPLTLPSRSSLHLAVSYFQKLGLRYVLFVDKGVLRGLLTKKDVWYVLNGAEGAAARAGSSGNIGAGGGGGAAAMMANGGGGVETGVLRMNGEGETRGLLSERREMEAPSPGAELDSIL